MKNISLLVFTLLSFVSYSQKEDINGNLIGFLEKEDFIEGKNKDWFLKNYDDYTPSKKIIRQIKKKLTTISIKSFIGTWCHDSHRELPRFYKVMESANFDFKNNFQIIGITRGKKTPDNLQEGYHIKHTPTFIFYKNGKEIGRYIEHSKQNIEKDILKILREKK